MATADSIRTLADDVRKMVYEYRWIHNGCSSAAQRQT